MTRELDFIAPLFVPAHRPERFEKAAASGADAVILDLEDAVPGDAKATARARLRADFGRAAILVRINGWNTPWFDDDLAAVASQPFAGVIVPKADVESLRAAAARLGSEMAVIALVETASGLAEARAIAALACVRRLAFGSVDFSADLGCAHTREALLAARGELVLASRLARKTAPIDGVTTSIDVDDLVSDDARHARDLGFGGKLCIHPRQIAPVLAGFAPTESEIAWARKILASGDGAVAVEGSMVDEPVRARARSLLSRSRASAGEIGQSPKGAEPG
jgi:citrate lyase subunit beta/citryl-CoA lyase